MDDKYNFFSKNNTFSKNKIAINKIDKTILLKISKKHLNGPSFKVSVVIKCYFGTGFSHCPPCPYAAETI